MAALTHDQMAAAIAEGQTILYEGRHIGRVEDLPTQADLAGDDAAKIADARAGLAARQAALDVENAKLDARDQAAQATIAEGGKGKGKAAETAPADPPQQPS